jgi:trigger factor
MLVTVESMGKLERRMRVELPAERIEQEVASRLQSVGRTAKIKGFRPGKVPKNVVKQRYGGQIRQEVLSELMQKSFTDAVRQENLNPAGGPKIESEVDDAGQNFSYFATFEIMPEVVLKNLDKIKIETPEVSIGEADVDAMLLNLRKQKATWEEVERASTEGDRVVVDFDGSLQGEPITGGQGKEVPVVLGQGQMLPDFEKALFGIKAGDEKSFKVKFPKDYQDEELAGKKVDFTIKTHRVEEESLPDVDDKLAELFEVKEGGIERFLQDVRDNMQRESEQKAKEDVREQVMQGLLDANEFDVPATLKHQEMHAMQRDAMQRMGIEDDDKAPGLENFAEAADKRVRIGLLLRQLISDQNLKVETADIRAHVEQMCASYESSEDMVSAYMDSPQIVQQVEPMVLEQQAVNWLMENGKNKSKKVSFSEYMNS